MTDQLKTDAIRANMISCGEIDLDDGDAGYSVPNALLLQCANENWRVGGGWHVVMPESTHTALLETIEAKDKRIAGLEGAIRSVLDHMRSHGATGTCFAGVVGDLESALTGTPSNLVVVDKQDYDILRSLAGVEADGYVTVERERLLQEPERSECSRDGESAES